MSLQRAYSYVRFSKGDQAQGNSLERQLEATRTYCHQHNLALDESLNLQDLGVSGYTGRNLKHGALGRFVAAVEDGSIASGAALVIEDQDRLSRLEPKAVIGLLLRLLEAGIDLHLTATKMVFRANAGGTQQAMDLMMAVSFALKAHQFSAMNSERLSRAFSAKRRRAAEGEKVAVSKSLPWWLTWSADGKTIEAPPERVAVLREIFRLTAEGLSSARIARIFNGDPKRYPTFRQGAHWHDNRVRMTVQSDAPLGVLQATPKTAARGRAYSIPGYYPSLISKQLAAKARAMIERNGKHAAGRQNDGERPLNIFRRLLRWQGVAAMRHSTHRNGTPDERGVKSYHGYYEAFDALTGKLLACVPANQLEPFVLAALDELKPTDLKPFDSPPQLLAPRAKAHLEAVRKRHQNLLKLAEEGGTSVAGIVSRLSQLETELATAEEELERAERRDAEANTPARIPRTEIRAAKMNLQDNPTRERLGYALRRLIDRIDVGWDIGDLPLSDPAAKAFTRRIQAGDVTPIPDPVERSKRRKPVAVLIHFTTGARRMVVRMPDDPDDQYPNTILSVRIDEKDVRNAQQNARERTHPLLARPRRITLAEALPQIAARFERSTSG